MARVVYIVAAVLFWFLVGNKDHFCQVLRIKNEKLKNRKESQLCSKQMIKQNLIIEKISFTFKFCMSFCYTLLLNHINFKNPNSCKKLEQIVVVGSSNSLTLSIKKIKLKALVKDVLIYLKSMTFVIICNGRVKERAEARDGSGSWLTLFFTSYFFTLAIVPLQKLKNGWYLNQYIQLWNGAV